MKNPKITIVNGEPLLIDAPEKPKSCDERKVSCCKDDGDCTDQCGLLGHDMISYRTALQEAIKQGVKFQDKYHVYSVLHIPAEVLENQMF